MNASTLWPVPYPVCPSPVVNSIRGCDFVDAAPPHALASIVGMIRRFKSGERHGLLLGSSDAEQARLRVRLLVLWHTLEKLRPRKSAIVELGTYRGTTAMGIRMVMDHLGYRYPEHVLHVYDSFRGLPPPTRADGRTELKAGGLSSSIDAYLDRFRAFGLDPPYIHKGFFGQIPHTEFPRRIAYAFWDGDFYESIADSFNRTFDKMMPGGAIVIDDYFYRTLEGVKRCVDDELSARNGRAVLHSPPLNVSHKHTFVPSLIPFANYEGVVRMADGAAPRGYE